MLVHEFVLAKASRNHQVQQPSRRILLTFKGQLWAEHLVPNHEIQKLQVLYLVSLRGQKATLSLVPVVPKLYRTDRLFEHCAHEKQSPPHSTPDFAPRGDCRRGDPRSMVLVRLAGTEVTEGFWAKLAGLS